jgi:hypothetical protein
VSKTYRSQFKTKERDRVKTRKTNKLLRQKINYHEDVDDDYDEID